MTLNTFSEIIKKPAVIILLTLTAVLLAGGLRIMFYVTSPAVLLLNDRAGAHWVKYDSPFELDARPSGPARSDFKFTFHSEKKVHHAVMEIQALKKARVFFDGTLVFSSGDGFDQWKTVYEVKLPPVIEAGSHEIIISVIGENTHPAVIAYSSSLPLKTGKGWYASKDGRHWRPAVEASRIEQAALSTKYPSSLAGLMAVWPYLAIVFCAVFAGSIFAGSRLQTASKLPGWRPQPSQVRWVMLLLWGILSFNNMFKLNFQAGSDLWGHMDYIDYIATKWSLPLAYDGWQMFQAPLHYILSAPLYAVSIRWFDLPVVVKTMGIIPVLCGLLQIEIVYRVAKTVFAQKKDLQIIAIVSGACLPVHTYVCQYVGNEPMVACLISLVILFCTQLVMPDSGERGRGYFIALGLVWGLALLSKMTAFLLAPVLIVVIAFHTRCVKKSPGYFLQSGAIVFAVSFAVAGWYYLRNYLKLGNAFMGLFDPLQMMQWWQDPGYRTLSHLLSFGQALSRPVYAGVTSFWDMFYATLWLDGVNSGLSDVVLWNVNFMVAGALLALLPGFFILSGAASACRSQDEKSRRAVILSAGLLVLFLAAMVDMYMVCPVYSRTKASYTLGLLPCYALLIAAGAGPFLGNRVLRAFSLAMLSCWAFAAYAAYFVV